MIILTGRGRWFRWSENGSIHWAGCVPCGFHSTRYTFILDLIPSFSFANWDKMGYFPGYRSIPLKNQYSEELELSSLLVHVELTYLNGEKDKSAHAIMQVYCREWESITDCFIANKNMLRLTDQCTTSPRVALTRLHCRKCLQLSRFSLAISFSVWVFLFRKLVPVEWVHWMFLLLRKLPLHPEKGINPSMMNQCKPFLNSYRTYLIQFE